MKKLWTIILLVGLLVNSLEAGRFGRGGGGRSGGRSGGGWFSRSSSRSSSSRSSSSGSSWGRNTGGGGNYPKQNWGSNSGGTGGSGGNYPKQSWGSNTGTGGKQPVGGGGFVNPKPGSNSGGGFGGSKTPVGGGGFVNPKPNYGSSYGSYGSRYGSSAAGFGGAKVYSYRSPGYGTNFGTSFPGGVGKYGGKGFSKKALGLGVGAGFLGGAALGAAGTMATYGVYHRYNQYRYMMMMGGYHNSWNNGYYNDYYYGNRCYGGCPFAAHCEWGFCECNRGYEKRFGRCERDWSDQPGRPANFDPFIDCMETSTCQRLDMNLICNTNKTVQAGGKCECRNDMRWNKQNGECQIYIDVDCSSITYDTKPSQTILDAVNKTLEKIEEKNQTETASAAPIGESIENETDATNGTVTVKNETISMTPNETLSNSLLSSLDPKKTSEAELKEAFCRDIDSFSFEFAEPPQRHRSSSGAGKTVGSIIGIFLQLSAFLAMGSFFTL